MFFSILSFVSSICLSVSQYHIVRTSVKVFSLSVAKSRWKASDIVTLPAVGVWLVESHPLSDAITEQFKTQIGIIVEIVDNITTIKSTIRN